MTLNEQKDKVVLFDHQRDAIALRKSKWGLFFDPGLGKSLTAIKYAESFNLPTCLIVTTKGLRRNWQNEVEMYSDGTTAFQIVTKEEFRRDWNKLPNHPGVIFDEVHYFGNPKSLMHKAAMKYIKKHEPRCIYGLTATPIMATVWSVWAIAKLLGVTLGYNAFKKRYFHEIRMGHRMIQKQKTGIEDDITNLLRRLGSVVSKEDALDLPEQIHEFEYFDLTPEQKKGIKNIDNDPTSANHTAYWHKVIQVIGGVTKNNEETFKSKKRDRIIELGKLHKKLIIVCKYKAELYDLQQHLDKSYIYCGDTKEDHREEILKKMRENDEGILLLQADMGIGFNLIEVPLIVFHSHTHDFITYTQCLGRNHRIGQTKTCVYLHMLAEGTIDEGVWDCLERKESFDISLYQRDN